MEIDKVRTILIIGAGTMGTQIGFQCASHDYSVTIYDINTNQLNAAKAKIYALAKQLVTINYVTQEVADAALGRISYSSNPKDAAAEVDLLSESVTEDPEVKMEVFSQFGKLCPTHTIFTTNTSGLIPSMFADATRRSHQFAALHFNSPIWYTNIVEIMPHPKTSKTTIQLLELFTKRIGLTPFTLRKENPGYIINALLPPLLAAAVKLKMNDVASIEDIDRVWMNITKMPIGPFGILDHVGLDVAFHSTNLVTKATDDPGVVAMLNFYKEFIDKGWLGEKSGRGFYTYPNPKFRQPGFLTGES
ncbi:3-hydroxyacyl-CoA dehydrogenase [Candidatus Bathyarchaeota archaeon]|nr:3-hydroxyacyl-CoA dehydrogenase [Candidatus Bathyarchaeota archaeon]